MGCGKKWYGAALQVRCGVGGEERSGVGGGGGVRPAAWQNASGRALGAAGVVAA